MIDITQARRLVAEYLSSGETADVFWMNRLNDQFHRGRAAGSEEVLGIVFSSGYDVSPCGVCGTPIVCIPDGLPMCETCAKKEDS